MSVNLKQAVERLEVFVGRAYTPSNCTQEREDVAAVLSALSRAEAERDLLAAECRASRKNDACANYCTAGVGPECEDEDWADATNAMLAARAATDAAGVLKLSGVLDPECAYMAHADTACTRCGRIHRGEGK